VPRRDGVDAASTSLSSDGGFFGETRRRFAGLPRSVASSSSITELIWTIEGGDGGRPSGMYSSSGPSEVLKGSSSSSSVVKFLRWHGGVRGRLLLRLIVLRGGAAAASFGAAASNGCGGGARGFVVE